MNGWNANNAVTLTVNGMDYAGWTAVRIAAGIERQARDFSLEVTWQWPGRDAAPHPIEPGARCEVRIGADLVLTGYVFATPIRYDAHELVCAIVGRSLTADVIDCSAHSTPSQWRSQRVAHIVAALAAPYQVQVIDESKSATTLADHTIETGETVFESIDRLLKLSRLLSTDDAHGRIVLARPGSAGRATDALKLGLNIKSADAALDFSGVFSEYICQGQQSGTDESFGVAASEVQARFNDTRITRTRTLVRHEHGQMTPALARARVQWESANRISKALKTIYEVQGWRQSDGALWQHNMIVRVVDSLMGFERDMLIVEVEYRLNNQNGMTAQLTVAPPDGFEADPSVAKAPTAPRLKREGDHFEYLLPTDWEKR